jgi:hypothetical protein
MGRSFSGEMVLRKGVVMALGKGTREDCACSERCLNSCPVAAGPLKRSTESRDWVHSSTSVVSSFVMTLSLMHREHTDQKPKNALNSILELYIVL